MADITQQIPQEVKLFLEGILEEADLLILTDEEKQKVLESMNRQFNIFLLSRVLENLPEDKMDAFEQLDENGVDPQQLQTFLQENVPNVKEMFEKGYEDFRELYLDTIAIEGARMEAIAEDATTTSKSLLAKLASGQLLTDQ